MASTKVKYGRQLINDQICGVVFYIEPETEDEIVLISPPYSQINAYRNGKLTGVTREMVVVWTEIAGLLGSKGLLGGFR